MVLVKSLNISDSLAIHMTLNYYIYCIRTATVHRRYTFKSTV